MRRLLLAFAISLVVLAGCKQGGPSEVEALIESGQAHVDAGEYGEAIADLEAAAELDPDNVEVHLLLGEAYNWSGDLGRAKEAFETVLAFDPESAAAHHNLGVVYFQSGATDAALAELQAALDLDPDDPDTHYLLGVVYLNQAVPAEGTQGEPDPELIDLAAAEFQAALDGREGMPQALIGMANVYLMRQDYESAIEILEQVLEEQPDSPEATYALAQAYVQSGDIAQACQMYDTLLTLQVQPGWQEQAQKEMVQLGCQ